MNEPKKEDLVQSDPVVKLCGSVHSTWPTRKLPEFDERCRDEAFWGITYMLRLYHWVSTLRWAPHVQEDEWGVSWIELFLSFQMSTESDIPVNLSTDDRPLVTLPEHNEAVKLIKPTTHKRMISFEKSLRALEKILGVELFPCNTCSTSKPPGPRFLPCTTRSSEKAVVPFPRRHNASTSQ